MRETLNCHIELDATKDNYERFMAFVESGLGRAHVEVADKTRILTACEEITVNVIKYAYAHRQGTLSVVLRAVPEAVTITFTDGGTAFNPLEKFDGDIPLPGEKHEPGGFGIFMVRKLMDDVQYAYRDKKNILQITRRISGIGP